MLLGDTASLSPPVRAARRTWDMVVVFAVFMLVSVFYVWDASPGTWLSNDSSASQSYYNLLVDGFRSGHVSMNREVPAGLMALKDPYDPALNAPYRLHDASYFNGHFYLYFGVAPVVTVFWPYLVLTGRYISDLQATAFFAAVGLAGALWLLLLLRWRFFPALSRPILAGAAFAVGLCTMMPSLLRRVAMWEVPIVSAYAFGMLAMVCLYSAIYGRRRMTALSLASLAYGFAVASRPTYAFGALALWVPLCVHWTAAEPARRTRHRLGLLAAVVLPIGAVVAGLLVYNQQRFGNPLEFGENYQMSGNNEHAVTHFSAAFFLYNLRVYLLAPARLSPYFPFIRVINAPKPPVGYLGIEDPYGVLVNIPVTLFLAGIVLGWKRLGALKPFVVSLGLFFGLVSVTVCFFGWATNRYMVDFMPAWILLATVGFLVAARSLTGWFGTSVKALWVVCLAVSCGFNVFAALGHNELLRVQYPKLYSSLAHAFNWPSYAFALATHTHYRPVSLTVRLPKDRVNQLQPLLVSGVGFLSDYVYLYYPTKDTIVIGYEHTSGGGPVTAPIRVNPDVPHVITIEAGFLYPPLDHPYFDRMTPSQAQEHKDHYGVRVDGLSYLATLVPSYDPVGFTPLVGTTTADRSAFGSAFTGEILKQEYINPPPLVQVVEGGSPIRVALRLPPFTQVRSEPLVTTGVAGAGDNLFITYLDPTHIAIGLDHWSHGGPTSLPIEVQYDGTQVIDVSLGSFYSPQRRPESVSPSDWAKRRGRMSVSVNGVTIFARDQEFYDALPSQIQVGKNIIESSTSGATFSGKIVSLAPIAE